MNDMDPQREALCAELHDDVRTARLRGRRNYYMAYALFLLGLLSSIVAGALGLFAGLPSWVIGLIALVPGAATLLGREAKLQAKANYHYRLASELDAIRTRARYSKEPNDNTGNLAFQMSELKRTMSQEWAESLGVGHGKPIKPD